MFLTLSLNYERLFPVNEKNSFGLRAGLGRDGGNKDNTAIAEVLYLYGKRKYFLELRVSYQQPNLLEEGSDDNPKLAIIAGYRDQAPKGFCSKSILNFFLIFGLPKTAGDICPFLVLRWVMYFNI